MDLIKKALEQIMAAASDIQDMVGGDESPVPEDPSSPVSPDAPQEPDDDDAATSDHAPMISQGEYDKHMGNDLPHQSPQSFAMRIKSKLGKK